MKRKVKTSPTARSGRFGAGPAAEVAEFTESISFDWRLWRQDIQGSKAHATMLGSVGLLKAREVKEIVRTLDAIADEIEAGSFRWQPELEDVHMNIEAELTRRCSAGAKLHTGRSRNDQVALDLRLWLREQARELLRELGVLQKSLVDFAAREADVILPGYTHLQRAQPVYLAHHLLAYVEMIERDRERVAQCSDRLNVCPLGAGALAGSTLPLDRALVAKLLGFVDGKGEPRISRNSMDAVADRDFAVEFCAVAALLAMHLSRLAEDLVLWATSEFGFVTIADAYTTGSSLMPQKKNPDVAELLRGKTGRVYGNLVALLTLLKGLPMAYNRDLQEDKQRVFDTADTVRTSVRLCAAMLDHCQANRDACLKAASDPLLLATELADYLVKKGVPFRQAHHKVGELVAVAEGLGKKLNELTVTELQLVDEHFEPDALAAFDLNRALANRRLPGSPGTAQVRQQIATWQKSLSKLPNVFAGGSKKKRRHARRSSPRNVQIPREQGARARSRNRRASP